MKSSNDLVSIILPTHNAEETIDRCIESIINQTFKNWELICCDDCSSDNTLNKLKKWVERDSRIVVLSNKENLRAAATRNKCFKIAKGNYIAQIDDDDYMKSDRLEEQLSHMKDSNFDFVGTSLNYFDEEGIWKTSKVIKYPSKQSFLKGSPFSNPSMMFKRECLENVCYYRVAKETVRGQDYDLFMRLYSNGYKGFNLEEPLTYYYRGKQGYRKTNYKIRYYEFLVRYKNYKELNILFPKGYIYCLKPLVLGLIPFSLLEKIKRKFVK